MFEVLIEGDKALAELFDRAEAGLIDLSVPTQEGLKALGEGVIQTFADGPGQWEPLKDGGAAHLYESGDMFVAAASAEPGVEGSVYALAPDGLEGQIGVEDLFHGARRHQLGFDGVDSLGRNYDEPPRAFLLITDDARAEVMEIFDAYLGTLTK